MANETTNADSSFEDVPKELQPLLKDLPDPQKRAVIAVLTGFTIQTRSIHRGPLPSPQTLKAYNEALPGGAERIFASFEKQSQHRMDMEKGVVESQQRQSTRGQHYGLIVALVFIIIAGILAYTGHDTAGIILGTVDLVALVTVFIVGKSNQRRSLKEKDY